MPMIRPLNEKALPGRIGSRIGVRMAPAITAARSDTAAKIP
jgi:hypothetical protein